MALTQVKTSGIADDAVTLAKQAAGTDGQIITYDASGNPVAVGPGTDGQVLTSTGAGSPPAFEDAVSEGTQVKSTGESGGTKFLREDGDGTSSWQSVPAAGAALTGSTNNTITTVTGANAIQGEANLTFDGTTLTSATAIQVEGGSGDTTLKLHRTNAAGSNGNYFGQIQFTDNNDNEVASVRGVRSSAVDDAALVLSTRPTGGSVTERMRIKSTGEWYQYGYTAVAASTAADDLVIGNADSGVNRGMTIFSNPSQSGSIGFADSDANYQGAIQYLHASDSFRLLTSANERSRISSEGIISTCSINHGLTVSTTQDAGTNKYLYRGSHSGTEGTSGSGNIVFNVWSNGNVESATNSYGSTSDVKLKENIVDANSQWNDIKTIKIRNYNFKAETGNPTHTQIGLVAQELETVCPKLVYETPDLNEKGEDLETTTKAINYSVLYIKAIKALQEAMSKIETLETKVAALEAK